MSCYRPVEIPKKGFQDLVQKVPCGKCVGCKLDRARSWAIRCVHEASLYGDNNCYITLTYDDKSVPADGNLRYVDFQLFMKRLRARYHRDRIRFFMCGEYGKGRGRPHFHALLFNFDFADKVYWCNSPGGEKLYRSKILEVLWPFGFSSVGSVTFKSAAYVARYTVKKANEASVVDLSTGLITERTAEFVHMSLGRESGNGIGGEWLNKFQSDVYPHGKVVNNGVEVKPPRYYDKKFAAIAPLDMAAIKERRVKDALVRYPDNTPERLSVKEQVEQARVNFLLRSL